MLDEIADGTGLAAYADIECLRMFDKPLVPALSLMVVVGQQIAKVDTGGAYFFRDSCSFFDFASTPLASLSLWA